MIKFTETEVTFSEIPEEVTLCINISNCPIHCPDCHSKHLWDDIGTPLTTSAIDNLIKSNDGISCVCFMGGDANPFAVLKLAKYVKHTYPSLKIGWFSGSVLEDLESFLGKDYDDIIHLDYFKVGPYVKSKGGLDSKTTNQVLYKVNPIVTGNEKGFILLNINSKYNQK